MAKVQITDTILRDAHQSLIATRMRTEDMLPICDKLDQVGYGSPELVGGRTLAPMLARCLALIPAALIAAIIVNDTFAVGMLGQLDARAAGVGAAVIAAWRRAPLIAVIVIGAAVTAAVRALT